MENRQVLVHPSTPGAIKTEFLEALNIIDSVAAENSLQRKPYIGSQSDPKTIAFYVKISDRTDHPIILVWVHVEETVLIVQVRDEPSSSHIKTAMKIQDAFYEALMNHFGASRVEKKIERTNDPSWFGESKIQPIRVALTQ